MIIFDEELDSIQTYLINRKLKKIGERIKKENKIF